MSLLKSLLSRRGGRASPGGGLDAERGFLAFEHTGEVLAAERLLRGEGLPVEVKAPPPSLRTGCDMVLVCGIVSRPRVEALLRKRGLRPLSFTPVTDPLLEPSPLFQTTDFGAWLMVRSANMKLTFEKASGLVVNVSGGGCPDAPRLAALLAGRRLDDTGGAELEGRTLCSYALKRALEEARRLWRG